MNKKEFKNKIFSLTQRLYPMIMRLLGNDSDAKDAIQDIMLKLWKKRVKLSKHPNQSAYVFLTARNHCLDLLKKKKFTTVRYSEQQLTGVPINGHEEYELNQLIILIEGILQKCSLQHKEILILRDIDGLEYDEIAEITKLKIEHIRVIISRTRKFVQRQLKKNYNYE